MTEFTHVIVDDEGLHARSAVALVAEAAKWQSEVTVTRVRSGMKSAANDLMGLMAIEARCGDELRVTCEGTDEAAAAEAFAELMRTGL